MTLWSERASTLVEAYMRERLAWDTFSHPETATWGNSETTSAVLPWTASGGSAADFSISDGLGKVSLGTLDVTRFAVAGAAIADFDIRVTLTIPVLATGDTISGFVLARFADTSNYYSLRAVCDTTGNIDLTMAKLVGGANTSLGATASDVVAYGAGTVEIRFQGIDSALGCVLKGKVWLTTDDEPDTWAVEAVDASPTLVSGQVGVSAILGAANTNTLPVVLSHEDFTCSAPPRWVDLTTAVLVGDLGQPIEGSVGRQTELSQIDESNLAFTLKNQSGWFTPDNIVSPYWPDWTTGVPIRWSETLGARRFPFPDMWLEIPEVSLSFEAQDDPERTDRVLRVNCVGLLTRLERAPRFVSNLAEYIKFEAAPGALRAFWPLADAAGSTYATSVGPVTQEPLRYEQVGSFQPTRFVDHLINFGSADGVPYDDGSAAEFTPLSYVTRGRLGTTSLTSVDPSVSEFLTLVAWVYPSSTGGVPSQLVLIRNLTSPPWLIFSGSGDQWLLQAATDGDFSSLVGPQIEFDRWHLLGAQMDLSDGSHELWVDGSVTAGTMAAGGVSAVVDRCVIDGGATDYRINLAQVYVGDADAFTHADFLAQYDIGANGWAKQRVDERIRQIANYAGIGDGQLDLEESDSLIQPPTFAGQRPGTLASEAAVTGGGILFTRDEKLVYQDRKHRFNL